MANEFAQFPTLDSEGYTAPDDVVVVPYVPITHSDLNLEDELLAQYNAAKKLYHDASYDLSVPLGQKTQALNSISTVISAFVKMKQDLYNMERIKTIEAVLLQTLKAFPEVQKEFMEAYEKAFKS